MTADSQPVTSTEPPDGSTLGTSQAPDSSLVNQDPLHHGAVTCPPRDRHSGHGCGFPRLQPKASSFHCTEKPTQRPPHKEVASREEERRWLPATGLLLLPRATARGRWAGRKVATAPCSLGGRLAGMSDLGRVLSPETQCVLQTQAPQDAGLPVCLAPGAGMRSSQGGSCQGHAGLLLAPTNGPEDKREWPCRVARRMSAAQAPVSGH